MSEPKPNLRLVASTPVSTVIEASDRPVADEMTSPPPRHRRPTAIAILVLAAALVALPFATHGGVDETVASSGNTWTEIVLIVLGAVAVSASVLYVPAGRRNGAWAVAMMALLFALTAASIGWSVVPDSSWLASGQMLAYLLVFAGAVALARLAPNRWPVLLGGLLVSTVALCLWSLVVKVFPATLASNNHFGRLQAPFGYWNALAVSAVMGVPVCLWLGSRRDGGRRIAGLAAPALSVLVAVLVLSYSRSADLAAVVAGGLWFVFVPQRLRAAAMFALGLAGGAAISVWALTHHAISHDKIPIAAQDHAGHTFGIVIAVVLVVVAVVGVALARQADRTRLTDAERRFRGGALLVLVGLVVVAAVVALAVSSRGLTGEISYGWHELANPQAISGDAAGRVLSVGSSRPLYWHAALAVGDHATLKGVGALGFSVARLHYYNDPSVVFQAHSYVFETYADLGVLGLLVTGALLAAWLASTGRALAPGRRRAALGPAAGAERDALITLAALVVGFGVQSTLDWTWFFAGVSVPALLAAGWLAGRGPLGAPVAARRRSALDRPAAVIAVPVVCALALLGSWMVWRPLHSAQLISSVENGSAANSLSAVEAARSADPLSLDAYQALSAVDAAIHRPVQALAALTKATQVQPDNPNAWASLAQYQVAHRMWAQAGGSLHQAQSLDRTTDALTAQINRLIAKTLPHLTAG
jgi:hypothetical protein